jgi:uncharacterized membrane protein YkvA (DUF1232 family)
MSARDGFMNAMIEGVLALPYDLKALLRLVEDPDLDDESRVEAAGGLLHVLSGSNAIPGVRGLLAYVDDVLVLRLLVERIAQRSPDALARHADESSQLLESWGAHLRAARAYLGELMVVLERAADGCRNLVHEGHDAATCARDTEGANWLYDEIQERVLKLDFPEDEVSRALRGIEQVLPQLRTRVGARPV